MAIAHYSTVGARNGHAPESYDVYASSSKRLAEKLIAQARVDLEQCGSVEHPDYAPRTCPSSVGVARWLTRFADDVTVGPNMCIDYRSAGWWVRLV